ncbi:MAG: PspC domain-containing protein [Bacteroidota bacterium]
MKKNISINISGIIFHIEEDAYEALKNYLDSINEYFSTFEDNQEIIADIESRIAEIFLTKLNEDKQVITTEDVQSLISTMGSIRDFQAAEEPEIDEEPETGKKTKTEPRRFFRDENRKVIGGVCAGLAHYFKIDPLWIRLIFVILLLGYGIILLAYLVMWAVIPGNSRLKEDKNIKKMYRDPDKKVIGGVAAGVAAYLGVEVAIIRLAFVLSIFLGGTGLLVYIILWIVLTEATSITDKVKMKGEPVTLSNIETNVKNNIDKDNTRSEENFFVKILLFPFRLVAAIISGLGRALGPLIRFFIDFIRVIIGLVLIITGLSIVFSMVVTIGVILGIFSAGLWHPDFFAWNDLGFPLDLVTNSFPTLTALAAFLAIVTPSIFLMLLGSSMIAKRIVFSASTGWTLFAMFIISIAIISINVPGIAFKFREDGEYTQTETYDLADKTAVLRLNEVGMEDYEVTTLTLRGWSGSEYKLEKNFESQGSSRREAIENAKMVSYNVDKQDSILYFDSNIKFKNDAAFRAQRLEMYLYIPYNSRFIMDEDLRHIIRNTIYVNGYRISDLGDNIWNFTKSEGLVCISCEENNDYNSTVIDGERYDRTMRFSEFEDVYIKGAFNVDIVKGNEYKVLLKGRTPDLNQIRLREDGDLLRIEWNGRYTYNNKYNSQKKEIDIVVIIPYLHEIDVNGASKIYIKDLRQRDLSIETEGASYIKADVSIDNLVIDASGASEIELAGSGLELSADMRGASNLDAYEYEVKRATIDASGAASARAFVTDEIIMDESFISNVKFKGGARIIKDRNGN